MKYALNILLITGLVAGAPAVAVAQEGVITLEGARLQGGHEAPLVLYLIPWNPPEVRSLGGLDEDMMLARPIKPLQRSEFQRLISYHHHFQALKASEAGPGIESSRPE